jgi:diguanylate cyclase (GGDEF)-like protein
VHGEGSRDATSVRPSRWVGTARDVTEAQSARRDVAFLTGHDPQTGVASRHRVMAGLAECAGGRDRGTVVVIDVDRLGEVNELHGNAVGDEVLRRLASVLRREIDGDSVLGRISGDRFAAVLPGRSVVDALEAGARLCAAVDRTAIPAGAGTLHVGVSVGVAEIVRDDVDASLEHAGLALDEAKRTGRNRALCYTDELRGTGRRSTLLRRVAGALDDGSMRLHAQPIVDLRTQRVTRHELLVRLCDGQDPPLGPAEFLPPVECTDLVHRLDRWVVGEAIAALATPRARASGLRLEANLSGRSLEDPELGGWILDELRRHDVEPARLGVEITETAAITELAAARGLATRLVEAGVGFALDDFGAGFGSFAYLKHLRFTSVKIAGDFVAHVDECDTERALVGAVVALAGQMHLVTVAEQVDRPELVSELRRLGVDHGQGYHLGRPAPLERLIGPRPS